MLIGTNRNLFSLYVNEIRSSTFGYLNEPYTYSHNKTLSVIEKLCNVYLMTNMIFVAFNKEGYLTIM
jgi:hypothetical protein